MQSKKPSFKDGALRKSETENKIIGENLARMEPQQRQRNGTQ